MNVIDPGFHYQLVTTDLVTYPGGLIDIKFTNISHPVTPVEGVNSSLEIIEMMLDRYLYLSEHALDGTVACSISYRLAEKAEKIVKAYVDDVETP